MQKTRQETLDRLVDAIVPEAVEWVAQLRAYRTYQGKDPEYFRKARIGLGVVSTAVRLCATRENARTNDLIAQRLLDGPDAGTKQLSDGQ